MEVDPSKYDILLAGPRISRLKPFFGDRGYRTDPASTGRDALELMQSKLFHVVVMELDLEDLEGREFLQHAREIQPLAAYILLDDPAKSMMIVSTFVTGMDAYVATPPNEVILFEQINRHALASVARGGGRSELEQFERELASARAALEATGSQVKRLRDENEELSQQMAGADAKFERAEKANREEIARLKSAVDDEKKKAAAKSDISAEELKSLRARVAEGAALRQEVESLREQADLASILESEIEDLKAQLELAKSRAQSADGPMGHFTTGEGDALDDGFLLSEDEDGSLIVENPNPLGDDDGDGLGLDESDGDMSLGDVDDILNSSMANEGRGKAPSSPPGPMMLGQRGGRSLADASDDAALMEALFEMEKQAAPEGTLTSGLSEVASGLDALLAEGDDETGVLDDVPRLETRDFPAKSKPSRSMEELRGTPLHGSELGDDETRVTDESPAGGPPLSSLTLGNTIPGFDDDDSTRAVVIPKDLLAAASRVDDEPIVGGSKVMATEETSIAFDPASMGIDEASMGIDEASMGIDEASIAFDPASMGIDEASMGIDEASTRIGSPLAPSSQSESDMFPLAPSSLDDFAESTMAMAIPDGGPPSVDGAGFDLDEPTAANEIPSALLEDEILGLDDFDERTAAIEVRASGAPVDDEPITSQVAIPTRDQIEALANATVVRPNGTPSRGVALGQRIDSDAGAPLPPTVRIPTAKTGGREAPFSEGTDVGLESPTAVLTRAIPKLAINGGPTVSISAEGEDVSFDFED